MSGGETELILQRIDTAVSRIDAVLQQSDEKIAAGSVLPSSSPSNSAKSDLAAHNARLQAAVTSAIAQIDRLIAQASGEGA